MSSSCAVVLLNLSLHQVVLVRSRVLISELVQLIKNVVDSALVHLSFVALAVKRVG